MVENFKATIDFVTIYNVSAAVFGWTSQPSINHTRFPFAYFYTRISRDNTPVSKGKIGFWKTEGKNYVALWEHDWNF